MPFASECLEIAPACEEQMLGREGLPLLGEAGIFLTGLSRVRDHYLIRRNRPEFHILMVSHDEGGALLTDELATKLVGDLKSSNWNVKKLVRKAFTSDSFVRY